VHAHLNKLSASSIHAVGSMENLIYDYFVDPIWSKTGYNVVNTITYAIIAIAALFLIRRWMKGRIDVDEGFLRSVLCFVLFGSTIRVVTDAIDGGVLTGISPIHQMVLDSHLWDYGYLTVSPGTYLLTAGLLLFSMFVLYRYRRLDLLGYVGLALWLPHLLLLLPFMEYWVYAIPILVLAAAPAYIAWMFFKDHLHTGIVAGQALDGAATFFIIDFFSDISGKSYFEQHVFSAGIGDMFGTYFTFYIVKILIAFGAAFILRGEKMDEEDKRFIALALMIMGFAPGIRDILRMMVGA